MAWHGIGILERDSIWNGNKDWNGNRMGHGTGKRDIYSTYINDQGQEKHT
jgi:hypothetical protein